MPDAPSAVIVPLAARFAAPAEAGGLGAVAHVGVGVDAFRHHAILPPNFLRVTDSVVLSQWNLLFSGAWDSRKQ
jgi:hypothetical protein